MITSKKGVVLFADVSRSSQLYKKEGNEKAKQIIDLIVSEMSMFSEEFCGDVIKTIGDEVMVSFEDPTDAFNAARTIQTHYANKNVSIRIGMAYGNTLRENGDLFGKTVNDAAYIAHLARGEQILVDSNLFESLPELISDECHEYDRVKIKGESQLSTIYRIQWERGDTGEFATKLLAGRRVDELLHSSYLTISFGRNEITINHLQTPYKIGRGEGNDLQLDGESSLASRSHCIINFQHGKFVLIDHSSNGTFVQEEGYQAVYLRREEIPLTKRGIISLGGPIELSNDVISYSL